MNSVTVIGAGAWGTALAIQAARAGNAVTLWARDPTSAATMQRTRTATRLPSVTLPDTVTVTNDLALTGDLCLLVTPMRYLRAVVGVLPAGDATLVVCAKGVETDSLRLPLEILTELRPNARAAVLSGPNFAHEVAGGMPAAAVVACADAALRDGIAQRLATASFRLYGNDDPIGAQLGGAAKNIIAIAAGAVIGAGLGENARAALVTRGLAELARLTVALGGKPETVMGLSGLGDLLLTCTGPASRNFSLGMALGRGETLATILASRNVATEGVATAPALLARAAGIDLPICSAVAGLLAGQKSLSQTITDLLARPRRDE